MLRKISFLIITLLFLSGCWDQNDAERMLYIHGIGIDYKDNQFIVYAQIINFLNIAKSEQPKSEPEQSEIGYATGKTIEEATFNLYHSIDKKLFWDHLSFILLSENVLKNNKINHIIDTFIRFRETRYRIWVYSTRDSVEEVLSTVPVINTAITLSRLADPISSYEQDSFIEPIDMRELIIKLNEPSHEAIIPTISVTENWKTPQGKRNVTQLIGGGIVSPHILKGFITGEKALGIRWMNSNTVQGNIDFSLNNENEEKFASFDLKNVKVNVQPVINSSAVTFNIDIQVDATAISILEKLTVKEIKKHIEEEIKQQIMTTYLAALEQDIDIYRLSEHVYRKHNKAWKKLQKKGKIELNEESIKTIKVKVNNIQSGRKKLIETIE